MGETFSKSKYKEENKKEQMPPQKGHMLPQKKLTEEEKEKIEQTKLYDKYKNGLTIYIRDKLEKYQLCNSKPDELKAELPIGYIKPNKYPDFINVNTYLILKAIEQNNCTVKISLLFIIENPKDSRVLFIDQIFSCIVPISCYDNLYIEYIIKESFTKIGRILDDIQINTFYECFETSYYYDVYSSTEKVFEKLTNIQMHNKKCKKCKGYTKNEEYCYFCS